MNGATFSTMSRLILLRHRHLIKLGRINDSKLAQISSANLLLLNRFASSSTPTTTGGSPASTFGSGELGRPATPPKDVTIQPMRPEDYPTSDTGDESPYTYSPVYRKSRFDWLFGDGWRRPPAKDQGQRLVSINLFIFFALH